MIGRFCVVAFMAVMCAATAAASPPARLERIQARGTLNCGLAPAMPGFSVVLDESHAEGLDADLCRAMAVATLGSSDQARFVRLETVDQFLNDDEIDLVFHGLTWKPQREERWGIAFAAVTFHDGQAYAVRRDSGIAHAAELAGKTVCVENATIFSAAVMRARPAVRILELPDAKAVQTAFRAGRCDAWSWDASSLFAALSGEGGEAYRILPERLSHEPLAPIVRTSDVDLAAMLRWTMVVLLGGKGGVEPPSSSQTVGSQRARAIIEATGGFDAIYARNLQGPRRPLMDRGANRLRRDGGLMDPMTVGRPD